MTVNLVSLPLGTLVDGCRVVRELGNGGFSVVYLVEKNGQQYALKLARHRETSNDYKQTHTRLLRELAVLLMLDHPNIIRHRGYGSTAGGNVYLLLDYVDSWTLGEWMERKHPTFHEVLDVFVKLASALAYMHSRGILHRDLKLLNVLIRKSDGEPVIIDFSCATYAQADELTTSGLPPGTDRFRAPEQFTFLREHRDEHRARYAFQVADEIFSLGAMLYELLTDPRPTEDRPRLALNNPRTAPPSARTRNPRVPEALSDWTKSLLSRDPSKRPVDTDSVQREVAQLRADPGDEYRATVHPPLEQRPVESSDEGGSVMRALAPLSKPRGGSRRALGGIAAAVLVAGALALWAHRREAPVPSSVPPQVAMPPVAATAPSRSPSSIEPPEAFAPAMSSPTPTPAADAVPAVQKEGLPVKTQPPEAIAQKWATREQKTPPSAATCKALLPAAALLAGCTGVPVRPEPFECPDGTVKTMKEQLHLRGVEQLPIVLDDRWEQNADLWFRPGDEVVGLIPENVTRGQAKIMPPGTRFYGGKVYVEPNKSRPGTIYVKYERVKLPGQAELPICLIVEHWADELKDGTAKAGNEGTGYLWFRWP